MEVGAGFAVLDGHTPTSVRTGQVGREIQTEEVAPQRRTVRGLGGGANTDCQDLVWARPVKREFGREYLGVGVRLHTLADGGGRAVPPSPTTRPPVAKVGAGRSASARMEFLRLTRETVRAWCARTMPFARFCRSVAKSQ